MRDDEATAFPRSQNRHQASLDENTERETSGRVRGMRPRRTPIDPSLRRGDGQLVHQRAATTEQHTVAANPRNQVSFFTPFPNYLPSPGKQPSARKFSRPFSKQSLQWQDLFALIATTSAKKLTI